MLPADVPELTGAAMGSRAEHPAPGHLTPAQTPAAGPATDVPIKSESEAAQGKLSRKQRKKLGLSAPDLSLGTPAPIKAEPEVDSTDLQLPDHIASAPMQGADLSGLSRKQRKKLGLSAPDLAAATPLPIKAEPGPDSMGPQHPDHSASAAMQGTDLSGLSKKQRKKLRMSMPDPAALAKMSSDPGLDLAPDSMTGHSQGVPQSTPAGEDSAVAGNGAVVKEERGPGASKERRQNGQHVSAVKQLMTEPVLSNGHDIDRLGSSLPDSSRKKHKKSRKSEGV